MKKYSGKAIFEGFANAQIKVLLNQNELTTHKFAGIEEEFARFIDARSKEVAKLDALYEQAKTSLGEYEAKLFAAHKVMATDSDFEELVKKNISSNITAEEAVSHATKEIEDMLSKLDSPYLQARAADIKEIGSGIKNILSGKSEEYKLTKPTIIVCDELESSQIVQLDKKLLKGLVLTKGNTTAHVSIFARSIELPSICMVTSLPLDKSLDGKKAYLDSTNSEIIIEPTKEQEKALDKKAKDFAKEQIELKKFIGKPTKTKDGFTTNIYCNISSTNDLDAVIKNDGEGIGLFRSEYVYLKKTDYPSEEYQFNIYKQALEAMNGKKVIIRTFDIGADKKVSYFNLPQESNPALGYRSVRICLDKPEMFKTQLRALYRASAFGNLSIMVPMITNLTEVEFCKKCIDEVKKDLDKNKIPYSKDVKFGIMIEVPAAAICADSLAQHVDFFSIGTNDLTQYTLACDRVNPNLCKVLNPYHKALMRLIKMTIDAAHKYGKKVGMCGEHARDPNVLPFLMGLHIDEISLSPAYVLRARKAIASIDTKKVDIDKYVK
ncbi:MAG: phosphoenolpyruvate--protein phosphotransferase [Mycoplasmoidaceae bacterium]|nr:phosphoenolpyruvate--protein phosphotransferase [Mycoplasmoidaceae bacterium]